MKKNKEEIINKINELGYTLIEELPSSTKGKVSLEDSFGYRYVIELGKLLRGDQKPAMISKTNKFTIYNIKNYIFINNIKYKLVSEEFLGVNNYLIFNCEKHGDFKMTWGNFKAGYKCKQCGIESRAEKIREDFEEVRQDFINRGFTPLFNSYKNRDEILEAINEEGYKIAIKYGSFKYCDPLLFAPHNPYTIYNIKLWLEKNMPHIILLSENYTPGEKLDLYCTKHNLNYSMLWNNIQKRKECPVCGLEKRSGSNAPNYNPNLTEEERELGRKYGEYYDWRKEIFKRDNYTCQCCGQNGGKLNAHHLDGYNWCKEKRVDINNGITLCEKCHKAFHEKYGRGNNTREQFEEFLTII